MRKRGSEADLYPQAGGIGRVVIAADEGAGGGGLPDRRRGEEDVRIGRLQGNVPDDLVLGANGDQIAVVVRDARGAVAVGDRALVEADTALQHQLLGKLVI